MTLVDALSEAPRGLVVWKEYYATDVCGECHCVGAEAELARRWGVQSRSIFYRPGDDMQLVS